MNTILREKTILQNQVLTNFGLVSIIMPNYNCAKYLKDTIDSVLAQTYTNWELLFVDDCSTDDSVSMIQSFHDDRIKVFQSKQNGGAAIARNYAIEAARGRFFVSFPWMSCPSFGACLWERCPLLDIVRLC